MTLNIKEATEKWVDSWNSIPTNFVSEHMVLYPGDWEEVTVTDSETEDYSDSILPMWGTMWTFDNSFDDEWLDNNLDVMSELGFRIYHNNTLGYVFGIDGAGYLFFDEHFLPLYKARGLMWHTN